eukprot:scpid95414/ scgid5909/ 
MGVVSIIIRLVLNLAVGAGSVMILYGIVSSRVELPKHSYGADGTCLLWTSKSADGDKLITGPAAMCNFAIAFASVSILLAILLTIIFLRSIATGTADNCETFVFRHDLDDTEGFKWYPPMNIAQMGSWIVSGCWLFHLIFAIVDLRAYRKQKSGSGDITDPSDRVHILADPSTFEGSYRDDPPPPFEDKDPNATPRQAV